MRSIASSACSPRTFNYRPQPDSELGVGRPDLEVEGSLGQADLTDCAGDLANRKTDPGERGRALHRVGFHDPCPQQPGVGVLPGKLLI